MTAPLPIGTALPGTWTKAQAAERIIAVAERYLGLSETRANAAWDNFATPGPDAVASEIEREMRQDGWQPGWAYCAAFCEVVLRQAYAGLGAPPEQLKTLRRLLGPGVLRTKQTLEAHHTPMLHDATGAQPGAMFFMRLGTTAFGHAGIVVDWANDKVRTIEGNTSPGGRAAAADREGDGIWRKVRTLNFQRRDKSLYFVGFLLPMSSEAFARIHEGRA